MFIKLTRCGSLLFGCDTHLKNHLKLIVSVESLLEFWFGCLICFGLLSLAFLNCFDLPALLLLAWFGLVCDNMRCLTLLVSHGLARLESDRLDLTW